MLRKVVFSFAVLGLALASAKSYTVNLSAPTFAGATELKAGSYEVSLAGQNVVIQGRKVESQNPVRVETVDKKYANSGVKYNIVDGKKQIQEIYLGGTKTKLVFNETVPVP
jgi:hypothetical protein